MNSKFIFICGTGRSGTHFIGRTIASHPNIEGRIEDPNTFRLITKLASTKDYNSKLENYFLEMLLFRRLKRVVKLSDYEFVLEKSHPSIWLAEEISKKFKNSLFIGVYRDLEPTVASMLRHKGVLSWYDSLPSNKVNRFLGITPDNIENFHSLSI